LFLSNLTGRDVPGPDKPDHKTAMLCRQVERALRLALAGECDDGVLSELVIDSVMPAPNAGHLLVRVFVPATPDLSIVTVLERLARAKPKLRHLIGQSISRKRVPELSFAPLYMSKGGQDAATAEGV
jgi:ribosome-binding factor A